ncbi:trypsin-like serine peptidase [Burkholderia ubonensis]|uniref:trypsin-like serine peptidase n=1 Tax=Burkholderia ubonensis TaxID=101571 RepID=UPI0012F733C6|nr:serine protease [Burkholderia ubonensis]
MTLIAAAAAILLSGCGTVGGSSGTAAVAGDQHAMIEHSTASKTLRKDYQLDLLPPKLSETVYSTTVHVPDANDLELTFDRASLPAGGYVEISGGDTGGIDVYRAEDLLAAPVKVLGDTAKIRTILPRLNVSSALHLSHVNYEKRPSKGGGLKALIGNDDRRPLVCYAGTDMYRHALAGVQVRVGGWGSGAIVGDGGYLLTNQHVTVKPAGEKAGGAGIWFNWFNRECDRGSPAQTPVEIRTGPVVVTGDGGKTDYSLVELNSFDVQHAHTTELFGSLRVRPEGDNKVGDEIYIPQYGNGGVMPQVIGERTDDGSNATITKVGDTITYNADSQSGSSGSPVISRATNEIVGVHYAGGSGYNVGVRLPTVRNAIFPFIAEKNDAMIGAGSVTSHMFSLPPYSIDQPVEGIAPGATVHPFSDVPITHHGDYSEVVLDSQDELTGDLGSQRYRLFFKGPNGMHDLSSAAAEGDELVIRNTAVEAPRDRSSTVTRSWLPLVVSDSRGARENMIVRLQTSVHDPFVAPFDESSPDVIKLNLAIDDAGKNYSVKQRLEGGQYGFVALYSDEGPSQTAGTTPEAYASIQLPVRDRAGKQAVVRLRGYRATDCSKRSMNSTIGCGGGPTSSLILEYQAADNPDLPAGTYDGILPLQAQVSGDSAIRKNVLASIHVNVEGAPVAVTGPTRTVVATGNFAYAYGLNGSESSEPSGKTLKYHWRVANEAKGFGIRDADQANAEAIVSKDTTGEGVYELTVTSESGKTASARTKVIAVAPQVTLSKGAAAGSYSASANFGSVDYTWTLADASGKHVATGQGANWQMPADLAAGVYKVAVQAYSSSGERRATAEQSLTVEKKVEPAPAPVTARITGPDEATSGEKITLDASNSIVPSNPDDVVYHWIISPASLRDESGSNFAGRRVVIEAPDAGLSSTVTAKLSVYTRDRQTDTTTKTIAVKPGAGDASKPTESADAPPSPAYRPGLAYQGGDVVTNRGQRYECKPFPYSGWCGQAPSAYEPGVGYAWTDAWKALPTQTSK